jgi:hypothetical protein
MLYEFFQINGLGGIVNETAHPADRLGSAFAAADAQSVSPLQRAVNTAEASVLSGYTELVFVSAS